MQSMRWGIMDVIGQERRFLLELHTPVISGRILRRNEAYFLLLFKQASVPTCFMLAMMQAIIA